MPRSHCRPTDGIVRKRHGTLTTTRHYKTIIIVKLTSSVLPSGMIAKIERTPNTAQKQGPCKKNFH